MQNSDNTTKKILQNEIYDILNKKNDKKLSFFDITDEIDIFFEENGSSGASSWFKNLVSDVEREAGKAADWAAKAAKQGADAIEPIRQKAIDKTVQGLVAVEPYHKAAVDKVEKWAYSNLGAAPGWMMDERIPNAIDGIKRAFQASKRALDKQFNFSDDNIKQAIFRIAPDTAGLDILRYHFLLFGNICYDNLLYSLEKTKGQAPVVVDPGIYCPSDQLSSSLDNWSSKYRKSFILKFYGIREKDIEVKLKLINKYIDSFYDNISGFSKVEINSAQAALMGISEPSISAILPKAKCKSLIKNILSNDNNHKFSKNFRKQLQMKAPCILDLFVLFLTPVYEISKVYYQDIINSSYDLGLSVANKHKSSFSSFLKKQYRDVMLNHRLHTDKNFKKNWYAFCYNMSLDPYGERSFSSWKKETGIFVSGQYKGRTGSDEIGRIIYSSVEISAAAVATQALATNTLKIFKKPAAAARLGGSFPLAMIGLAIGITSAIIIGFDPAKWFTISDEVEEELKNLISYFGQLDSLYKKENKKFNNNTLSISIDKEAVISIKNNIIASTRRLQIKFHKLMIDGVQFGIEDEKISLADRRIIIDAFSYVVFWLEETLSDGNLDLLYGDDIQKSHIDKVRSECVHATVTLKSLVAEINGTKSVKTKASIFRPSALKQQKIHLGDLIKGAEFQKRQPIELVKEQSTNINNTVDAWGAFFNDIYPQLKFTDNNTKNSRLIQRARDLRVDIQGSIAIINNKEEPGDQNPAQNDINKKTEYISNFKSWWDATSSGFESTTDPKEPVKHTVYHSAWKSSGLGLKSTKMANAKYAWLIIGPSGGIMNSTLFFGSEMKAIDILDDSSEVTIDKNNIINPIDKGVKVEEYPVTAFNFLRDPQTVIDYNTLLRKLIAVSQGVLDAVGYTGDEKRPSLNSLETSNGEPSLLEKSRALNIVMRWHLNLIKSLIVSSQGSTKSVSFEEIKTEIQRKAEELHRMAQKSDNSLSHKKKLHDLRNLGVQALSFYDNNIGVQNALEGMLHENKLELGPFIASLRGDSGG
jgi:hypothetical protein